jgi:rubrerythrin
MTANNLKDLVKKNKKYVKEELNLNELIDKFLASQQVESNDRHSSFFHPSLISKGVECQLWWWHFLRGEVSAPNKFSDETLTAMLVGKGIHNQVQETLYYMGILEGVWKCMSCGAEFWALSPRGQCPQCTQVFKSWNYLRFKEVPIQTSLMRGHADGIIFTGGNRFLLELKSIKNVDRPGAKYGYEKLGTKPMDDHLIQAQLYMYGWAEIAKQAVLEEEYVIDETGKLSVEKLVGPVYDGAKVIGPVNNGVIEYVAKNTSQKSSYMIKRNTASIQFLLDEMQLIWKAYLEDTPEILVGVSPTFKSSCTKCPYKKVCSWNS